MKFKLLTIIFIAIFTLPTISQAKGAPLFFNTGDELFAIEGAPEFEEGYQLGYACQRFGLFGADLWTWDCEMMAINIAEFAAADLPEEMIAEYQSQYSETDRIRSFWNQFGAIAVLGGLVLLALIKMLGKKSG